MVVPHNVLTNEEMSVTVFLRKDQTPVSGVQIWAAGKDKVKNLKQSLKVLKGKKIDNTTGTDIQSILESNARPIGVTDENGKLSAAFNQEGKYWLVSFKAGFVPDFSLLTVKSVLAITGPEEAAVGDNVTFTITQKGSDNVVSDTTLWAIGQGDMPALKAALKAEFQAHKGDLENADWTGVLTARSELLGTTNETGTVDLCIRSSR